MPHPIDCHYEGCVAAANPPAERRRATASESALSAAPNHVVSEHVTGENSRRKRCVSLHHLAFDEFCGDETLMFDWAVAFVWLLVENRTKYFIHA